MEFITEIATTIVAQMQKPTLAFLIGGMMLAALGSKFEVPEPVYKFIVILLLLKVGLSAGISVREANLMELAVPAILAAVVGIVIILIGRATLARRVGDGRHGHGGPVWRGFGLHAGGGHGGSGQRGHRL
jgi:hypothetical protein